MLASTCKTLHRGLSRYLYINGNLPIDPEDRERAVFSIIISGVLYCSLDKTPHYDQIVTLRFASLYNETPLQHLLRNYMLFVPPHIGLNSVESVVRLNKEKPKLLAFFMWLDKISAKPMLKEDCREDISLTEIRGELCRNIQLLERFFNGDCVSIRELLNELRIQRDRQMMESMESIQQNLGVLQLTDTLMLDNRKTEASQTDPGVVTVDVTDQLPNFFSIPCHPRRGVYRPISIPRINMQDLRPRFHLLACVK